METYIASTRTFSAAAIIDHRLRGGWEQELQIAPFHVDSHSAGDSFTRFKIPSRSHLGLSLFKNDIRAHSDSAGGSLTRFTIPSWCNLGANLSQDLLQSKI